MLCCAMSYRTSAPLAASCQIVAGNLLGDVWGKLTRSLGIQRDLTSPYHPEGNSINERSHWTMNNMLRARLLRDLPSRK